MVLSERQKDILQKTVFEYIDRAQPVSSSWLETKYDMSLSPATIRSELSCLTEEGYLEQPHTSAGRVPTDRGYRFFVDQLPEQQDFEEIPVEGGLYEMGKKLAEFSSNLIVLYLPQRSFLWKEGWEGVLRAPEFDGRGQVGSFTRFLEDVEDGIRDFRAEQILEIYIGRENPFSKEKDFSIMIWTYSFPEKQNGLVALAGPKRMAYQKNIGLLNSLHRMFA